MGTVNGVRSELRKIFSTRLWWALLIPVAALSALINLFAGLFAGDLPGGAPLVLGSLAYTLGLTSVFAAIHGAVAMTAEFRHRTITTSYLTIAGRGSVLLAKSAATATVGALFAVVAVLVGVPAGLLGQSGGTFPPVGSLLALLGIGVVVIALWSVLGTALGTVITNQAVVLVVTLLYLLLGELLLSALLNHAGSLTVARMTAYLPGNATDVALYDLPARAIAGEEVAPQVVEAFAGVTRPPPWWGAVLVLGAWTGAAAAAAWVLGGRRDVT